MSKISIRFPLVRDEDIFDDREVRALWDEEHAKWWFSVLDIVAVLTDQSEYDKTRNYWKYLKAKLKRENSEVVSATTQLKLVVPDGKKRLTDMLDHDGIIALAKHFPNNRAMRFLDWLDLILKKRMQRCVDWSRIGKREYMDAMMRSAVDPRPLGKLLKNALTDRIDSREMYMKGIDHSYYYEEE